ncbi:MAG: hypothetical protein DMF94_04055 [Acidobacteria bacterium]|nr:MAG: hypothetical protein DMF94_04055 [Acidobacteriota bacterium]
MLPRHDALSRTRAASYRRGAATEAGPPPDRHDGDWRRDRRRAVPGQHGHDPAGRTGRDRDVCDRRADRARDGLRARRNGGGPPRGRVLWRVRGSVPVAVVRVRRARDVCIRPDPGDRRRSDCRRDLLLLLVPRCSAVAVGRRDGGGARCRQHRTGGRLRRARVLVCLDQGGRDSGVHRGGPRAGDRYPLVITSYMGIEGIAVTAGEAEHPETSIPRAMRTMVLRLIIFYVLAISVMLTMTPWNQLAEGGSGITGSPFVRAFAAVGIPYAAGAMNLVVISAAVSSANCNLYLTTRMLLSLARSGYAPGWLASVSHAGVPLRAVAIASAGMASAILLAVFAPASAFLTLYGTAVAGMLFIWIVTLFTYLRFRKALAPEQLARLPIRMPAHRAAACFGIVSLLAISATTFFVDGLQYSVVSFLPCLAGMSIMYARKRGSAT